MLENKKKTTLPLPENLTIAYGSESLERHLETETINAAESALMSSIPATLGSPPIHMNSGLNSGSRSRNQPIVSESFDKRKILKDRFLSSPRTLRVETMDSVNSKTKFNQIHNAKKKLDTKGFMAQTMEVLKKPKADRYRTKKKG